MIAIRPPEYFPRLSYLALLMQADRLILADTVQYSRQSFQNRSKLRNPQGWQWISVPLLGGQHGKPIREVKVDVHDRWLEQHWRAFMYNYRSTPYFEYYEPTFKPFFEEEWPLLGDLTCRSIELLAELIEIEVPVVRASELEGAPDTVAAIADEVGAEALLWPEPVPDPQQVTQALHSVSFEHPEYRQNFEGFEAGMSAADLIFNYGPESRMILTEALHVHT